MQPQLSLLKRLAERPAGSVQPGAFVGEVPASHYLDAEHFALEQERVFRRLPSVVATDTELREPGSCLATELAGRGVLLIRDAEGELRAFKNACRHRSTRLVEPGSVCKKKALTCPYHGWTYDLAGRIVHVPHATAFCGKEQERTELVRVHALSRYGLVFASLCPIDDAFLSPIAELESMGLAECVLFRRSERVVNGNWKLVQDAFLDAYHIRQLHRDTIYRFFDDARAEVEHAGHHVRAVTARRTLGQAPIDLERVTDLRELATPSYLVFPNTILIFHPDYASVLISTPLAPSRTRFSHAMLIPKAPANEVETKHWDKSFELIDAGVFEKEDLFTVEAMQAGLESGANPSLLFGAHEFPALWFHQSLAEFLATS